MCTNGGHPISIEITATDTPEAVRAHAELSVLRLSAHSDTEVLTALAARAEMAGWVEPTFLNALLTREQNYPTGLPTAIAVAIPHADIEHVTRAGLGIALLEKPVPFGEMGGSGTTLPVKVVVLILMTDPHSQLTMLTKLIELFQTEGWFDALILASDEAELAATFNRLMA
jgi:PTS system galactitol-specific IIA component